MHLYRARVVVARDELTAERAEQVRSALERFDPALTWTSQGQLEVWLALTAENLMEATMTVVSLVWSAVGAEPVAVDLRKTVA